MQPPTASLKTAFAPVGATHGAGEEVGKLKAAFERLFGGGGPTAAAPNRRIHVIRAPGRVNLIGEHTDYNDGYVFPLAIEPQLHLVCRSRDDGLIRLASTAYPGTLVEFSVQRKISADEPIWANYARGAAGQLAAAGIPLCGMDALIGGTLPMGAGLGSSAAVEVATALAAITLAGLPMDSQRLALLCQQAEHNYAGVPCGIMDQTIVAGGRAGQAMLLDCRDLSRQYVNIDARELRVVIVDSLTRHLLTDGEYAQRKARCDAGVAYFQQLDPRIKALRDVTIADLESAEAKLPMVVYRRCLHVVTENARTVQAADLLARRDYDGVGRLMVQSHESLRDDFEVSTPELDLLVDEAMTIRGVYGARMTGAGFGGCVVALAMPRAVDQLTEHLKSTFSVRYAREPIVYVTSATDGASVIE